MNHIPCGVVLSTFHIVPEQSFAFVIQTRIWTQIDSLRDCCFTIKQFVNLPRCATPVASYPFEIQNTTHLMSFALRATQPCFADPVIPSSLALLHCLSLRGQTLQLPISIQHSLFWLFGVWTPIHFPLTDWLWGLSFRTLKHNLLPTAILLTVPFGIA